MGEFCYGIDIGTNSARLMLAERECGIIRSRYKLLRTVRTGEGVHETRRLSRAAIQRTLEALCEFRKHIDSEYPQIPVFCFATSAVRDSSNAQDLLRAAKDTADLDIRILSGTEEAEIGFLGAVPSGCGGIIDIGGGSTEFVLGEEGALIYRRSFDAGTIRRREMFGTNSDIEGTSRTAEWARELFSELTTLKAPSFTGIGGTITTVSAMIQRMEVYDPQRIQGSTITLSEIEKLLNKLVSMTVEERKTLPGLQPQRTDIIPYGMAVLCAGMHALDLSEITVSDADNLEGYAIKYQDIIFS